MLGRNHTVEWKEQWALDFAATEGSWQVSSGECCLAEGTWMAILLNCGEPVKKRLSVHNIEEGLSSV